MSISVPTRDSVSTAVAKNVIVLALGLTINYINGTLIHTFRKHQEDVLFILLDAVRHPLPSRASGRSPGGRRQVELRGVGETEGCPIYQAVHPDQGKGNGDGAPQAAPAVGENRDVRNHAQQRPG
ncbi:unnamed protein product [Menidia menidia]|uniref:(Atlantic silverside) hypothetical protein n=1 Tax=Menidia menidia TaxID=238744 RepID=A0A8S4BGH8_9TELE|nr:unnamed protein product [Menidia menidia]